MCSILNSRLLKPTVLKFSFMFIEYPYNLSIRVLNNEIQSVNLSIKCRKKNHNLYDDNMYEMIEYDSHM